jgi:hypothetical protein
MLTIHNEKIKFADLEDFGDLRIVKDSDRRSRNRSSAFRKPSIILSNPYATLLESGDGVP